MNKDLMITWGDVIALCRRSGRKICLAALLGGLITALYALSRPIEYKSEATFREKSRSQADSARSFSIALLAGIAESNENTAVSALKSRSLLEKAIAQRGLQAEIVPDAPFEAQLIDNIANHLKVEYALARKLLVPIVKDNLPPVFATQVVYHNEIPLDLLLEFLSGDTFKLSGKDFKVEGKLGQGLIGPGFALTLQRQGTTPLQNKRYKLKLLPLPVAVERARKKLSVETDLRDKGMLNLSFKNTSRKETSAFLNALLAEYQSHLREEHQRICGEQITYLNQRQADAGTVLKKMMEKHAETLSKNMVTMDLLLQNQQNYAQKLLSIELELSRLNTIQAEGPLFYERLSWEGGDVGSISQTFKDIRAYRQQSDSIDIALKNRPAQDHALQKQNFENQLSELAAVRNYANEAKTLQAAVASQSPLPRLEHLSGNPKYLIRDWQHVLQTQMKAYREASVDEKKALKASFDCCVSNFSNYIAHLIHVLDVEEKLIQERLTHQQRSSQEFQGIDLATANQLYLGYSKNVNELEAEILHHRFLLTQMEDSRFEISALSTVLQDPISRDIIAKASQLTLQLKDRDNRTVREVERLQSELALQRAFLLQHIHQAQELLILRKDLYSDKILSLQNTTLELIQQMISVLHQQTEDYISSRRDNLQQERISIEKQQALLQKEMGTLPEKWASEKLIEQHVEMTKKMIEKITEAVETKNITANLDLSQSAPIDKAIPSIHPQRSQFILLSLLGAFMGTFGMVAWTLGQALSHGVPCSSANLSELGQTVVGNMREGRETLRRLATQLSPFRKILLLPSQGPEYATQLAELLGRAGRKTLVLPISFDQNGTPGLKEYLEGESEDLQIVPHASYDYVEAGGSTPYANELISTPKFKQLIDRLQSQYECILLVSKALPISAEGLHAMQQVPCAVITLTNETLPQLSILPHGMRLIFAFA